MNYLENKQDPFKIFRQKYELIKCQYIHFNLKSSEICIKFCALCIAAEQSRTCTSPLLSQQLSQISREMVDLLKQSPQCRMPFSKFIPSYHHFFGRQCRVADYGYNRLKDLFEAIPHVVQVGFMIGYHLALHLFKILLSDNDLSKRNCI